MIIYKELASFQNYYAGSDGEIYSKNYKKNHIPNEYRKLKFGRQRLGYHIVSLFIGRGNYKTQRVHVLICTAFHGERPKGMQCSHINDDKENNRPENLKWETDSENKKRKFINNGGDRGLKNSRSIFTVDDILKIRFLLQSNMTHQKIANEMNCSRTSISRIYNNKRYVGVA